MHSVGQLIREDANTESNWTPYQADQQRKFYKASIRSRDERSHMD
jgi:hypothetical protein